MRTGLTLCAVATALVCLQASAQPVLITSPASLNPGDTTITPSAGGAPVPLETADITVRATTLTINGRHTIRNLALENNAIVTHSPAFSFDYSGGAGTDVVFGMSLNVVANPTGGDVIVPAGSSIHAVGRGYGSAGGPGAGSSGKEGNWGGVGSGGSHGGTGGYAGSSSWGGYYAYGGPSYGDPTQPTESGSGGGNGDSNNYGGAGGGVVRLWVGGTILLSGTISANGASSGGNGGGGAGGSVWIETGTLSGAGAITANGGTTNNHGGGGGGGRIAVYWNTSTFTGATSAIAGTVSSGRGGGAGTIWTKAASDARGDLAIVNGAFGNRTRLPSEITDVDVLTVAGGAELLINTPLNANTASVTGTSSCLSHAEQLLTGLQLTVLGDLTIGAGSSIHAVGRGYGPASGPGAGSTGFEGAWGGVGSGGGHGGRGGSAGNHPSAPGGLIYDAVTRPESLGSGGGNAATNAPGGAGGGRLRISVGGTLLVNGVISVNGTFGSGSSGSGAGGSIWIDAGLLGGSGTITAIGGSGEKHGGSGGGGLVAIYACNVSFPVANISAAGGAGQYHPGAPGVICYGSSSISVTEQPNPVNTTAGQDFSLTVVASTSQGDPFLSYQWRRRDATGEFKPLVEGQHGRFFGVHTDTLTVTPSDCVDTGTYDVLITDACGAFPSNASEVVVASVADFNDDGFVNGDDFDAFAEVFETGALAADINHDGFVNGDDFDYFAEHFEAGC